MGNGGEPCLSFGTRPYQKGILNHDEEFSLPPQVWEEEQVTFEEIIAKLPKPGLYYILIEGRN